MQGVVTNFRSVQSHAGGNFDASDYTVRIGKLLKDLPTRFRDFEVMQFSVFWY
jgi:hypothetical protein